LKTQNSGGAAFPVNETDVGHGMTLRDYFAGQALAGQLGHHGAWDGTLNDIAKRSLELADAMLAERNKEAST